MKDLKMKKLLIICMAVAAAMACHAQSMYVTTQEKNEVNVRTSPSTSAEKVGTMSPADLLPYLDETGDYATGWYKVDFNGTEAYVSKFATCTVDAFIPDEMYGVYIGSDAPWDKTHTNGTIYLERAGDGNAIITMEWQRTNLPAMGYYWLATVKDGTVVATHQVISYVGGSTPMEEIMELAEPLEKPLPVGYDEFQNTLFFNGLSFSQYE